MVPSPLPFRRLASRVFRLGRRPVRTTSSSPAGIQPCPGSGPGGAAYAEEERREADVRFERTDKIRSGTYESVSLRQLPF